MKIIISPAKKMRDHEDGFMWKQKPLFLDKTQVLLDELKKMNAEKLSKLMNCNSKIAELNYERFQKMDLNHSLTPALFAYEGLQYQHMAPSIFTDEQLDYVEKHLCILSGFYGLLQPFDGINCYRLEMQTRLNTENVSDLYAFWGSLLADELYKNNDLVLNLASKEYSMCIEPYLKDQRKMIHCIFATENKGKLKVKGTEAKMLRGEMVRYMASEKIENIEEIKKFSCMGYVYSEKESSNEEFVYIKKEVAH